MFHLIYYPKDNTCLITDIFEEENLILLTIQASLKEVQNFIRASPELLI